MKRPIFILLIIFLSSCYYPPDIQNDNTQTIAGFDLLEDDKTIIMSLNDKNGFSIYKLNIDSTSPKLIIKGNKNLRFFNPRFSKDGRKIIFIGEINNDIKHNCIFIADSDGSNVTKITNGNELINQAIFSDYDSTKILFSLANSYNHSSPIGVDQPHGMDIYYLNIKEPNKKNKLTNINAYGLYNFSEFDENNLLMYLQGGEEAGMYILDRKSMKKKRIEPKIHQKPSADYYYVPVYSKKRNLLAFNSTYELYIMDWDKLISKQIFRNKPTARNINQFIFFNNSEKILFDVDKEGLMTINLDGSGHKRIKFQDPK